MVCYCVFSPVSVGLESLNQKKYRCFCMNKNCCYWLYICPSSIPEEQKEETARKSEFKGISTVTTEYLHIKICRSISTTIIPINVTVTDRPKQKPKILHSYIKCKKNGFCLGFVRSFSFYLNSSDSVLQ